MNKIPTCEKRIIVKTVYDCDGYSSKNEHIFSTEEEFLKFVHGKRAVDSYGDNCIRNYYEHIEQAYEIDNIEVASLYKEQEPLKLKGGDLVLFKNGDIRKIRENGLGKTGLGIYSFNVYENEFYCTTLVDNYDSHLNHKNAEVFNIERVICETNPHYRFVLQLFYEDKRLPLELANPAVFDWTRGDRVEVEFEKESSLEEEPELDK